MLGRHADLPVSPLLWEEFVRVWRSKWVLLAWNAAAPVRDASDLVG